MAHVAMNTAERAPEQTAITHHDLIAMLASRICHDLVSPIGAISNGVELMQLSQQNQGPELDLISQSADSANTRLRFYRVALGTVTPDQMISRTEILSILNALGSQQKHHFHWLCEAELTRRQVKLVFLLLMCLETSLPWGGDITIRDWPGGMELVASSDRLRIEDDIWAALENRIPILQPTSSRIQFALAIAELQVQNSRVSVTEDATVLLLRVSAL